MRDPDANHKLGTYLFGFLSTCLFIILAWALVNPPSKDKYNPYGTYGSDRNANTQLMPPPCVNTDKKVDCQYSQRDIEQYRTERSDLAAQWQSADKAHWGFYVGLLGIVLLFWTLYETFSAAKALSAQNRIALKATKAEFQPYIQASIDKERIGIVTTSLGGKANRITIAGKILFENTGQTPATSIYIRFVARHIIPFRELPPEELPDFPFDDTSSYNQALAIQLNPKEQRELDFCFEFPIENGIPVNTQPSLSSTYITARVGFRDMFCLENEIRATVNQFVFHFQTLEGGQRYDTKGNADDNPDEWAKARGGRLAPVLDPSNPQLGLKTL